MQQIKKPEQVQLNVTLPEVDLILSSMGQRPFDQVCDLIGNIRNQVLQQIQALNTPPIDDKKDQTQ
jgi:hypothetical protein